MTPAGSTPGASSSGGLQWTRPIVGRVTAERAGLREINDLPQWGRPMHGRMICSSIAMFCTVGLLQWSRPVIGQVTAR